MDGVHSGLAARLRAATRRGERLRALQRCAALLDPARARRAATRTDATVALLDVLAAFPDDVVAARTALGLYAQLLLEESKGGRLSCGLAPCRAALALAQTACRLGARGAHRVVLAAQLAHRLLDRLLHRSQPLLVLLQLMIPNVSFLGHFSGILLGTWQANGGLRWLLPSVELTRELEAWPAMRQLTTHARFVRCPDGACGAATLHDALKGLARGAALAWRGLAGLLGAAAASASATARSRGSPPPPPSLPSHDRGRGGPSHDRGREGASFIL